MSAANDILLKLNTLGARLQRDGDRLILHAGKRPIPEALVEEARLAKPELMSIFEPKMLTSPLDEHLRSQTASKAAEPLGFCEDAHGEHLRRDQMSAFDAPKMRRCSSKMLMVSTFGEAQLSCGFGRGEAAKVLTKSCREHLGPTEDPTAGIECCECGLPITERLETWWAGERCHRACGETAFEREKGRAGYMTERDA